MIRPFIVGSLFCVVFSYVAVVTANRGGPIVPSTQVSSISIIAFVFFVLVINTLLSALRMRPFDRRELIVVAIMAILPAGLPIFGFVSEFIPMAGYLDNPRWSSKFKEHLKPNLRPELFVSFESEEHELMHNQGLRIRDREAFPVFLPKDDTRADYFGRWSGYFSENSPPFWGEIPWSIWIGPIVYWCLFAGIGILLFYSLNELLFRQWYENEKLVFPHAELINAYTVRESGRRLPDIFYTPLFFAGLSVSFILLLYNGAVQANWLPGMDLITSLTRSKSMISEYFTGTFLEGAGPYFYMHVFFALIGLAFLLPAEISFSIWFFYLFMIFQQWFAVQLGYGESGKSFGANWLNRTNFMSAQGGGAMLVFGSVCLWKVRRQILAIFSSSRTENLDAYRLPSLLFLVSLAALTGYMCWAGVSLPMALLIVTMIVITTVTMVRLVSEGGLIGFQVYFTPFHLMNNFGLYRFSSWFGIKSLAASMPLFGSFFLDVKTFIAPTMMTCKNLAQRSQVGHGAFALCIVLAVSLTLFVSTVTSLALLYDLGLDSMRSWFYQGLPRSVLGSVNVVANNVESYSQTQPDQMAWTGVGAASMGAILWMRQLFFWFPHPIGLLMFVNPLTRHYWLSFLLAWVMKTTAVKYAKPETYRKLKLGFIGLFTGELLVVCIGVLSSMMEWGDLGIYLNR